MRQAFIRNTCSFFLAFSLLPVVASAQPTVWVTDSLTRTGLSDSAGGTTWEQLAAAKGEAASFQINVQAPYGGLNNVNVTMSNLTSSAGDFIPSTAFALFREQYALVQPGSVNWLGSNQPLGAGYYPDGLIPFTDPNTGASLRGNGAAIQAVPFTLGQYQNQPIWVDVVVPRTAAAGTYSGTYTVSSNQGSYTGYVTLTVWHFALPQTPYLQSSMVFWAQDSLPAEQEILRERLNPASSDPSNQGSLLSQGLQSVAIKYDSGARFGNCSMTGPPSVAQIKATTALQNQNLLMYDYSADEVGYCTNLYPLIKQWGYNLHQAGIKNLVTMAPNPALYDDGSGTGRSAVDIWTILPLSYDYNVSQMATVLAKGDSIWSYNALVQDAYTPKWEIDFAPINFRVQPGFISQSLNLTGLLYWRVDYWASDPWNWVNNTGQFSGNNYPGEGQLVYPGADVGIAGVAPSMRLKWLRDGSEDYDYIQMLKNAGYGSWAINLAHSVGPDWTNWTRSNSLLESVRLQMGQALDQIYGGSGSAGSSSQATTPSAPTSGSEVAPTVTSIVPSNSGNRTTFTITVNDANGAGDLAGVNTMVNAAYGGVNACWFYLNLNTMTASLADNNGSTWASVAQGSGSTIGNSQCSIAGTDFGVTRSGNSAIVTIAVNFNSSFAGTKSLFVAAGDNENQSSYYQNMGLWTVAGGSGDAASTTVSTPPPSSPSSPSSSEAAPTVVSIAPSNSGNRTTFTITVSDANGWNDLAGAGMIVNTGYNGANACWIYYNLNDSTVSLASNDGSSWATVPQGSGSTISNSQCSVAGTDFGAYRSGNTATITVAVTSNSQIFTGTKSLYVNAIDKENQVSNYQNMGLWTVP